MVIKEMRFFSWKVWNRTEEQEENSSGIQHQSLNSVERKAVTKMCTIDKANIILINGKWQPIRVQ